MLKLSTIENGVKPRFENKYLSLTTAAITKATKSLCLLKDSGLKLGKVALSIIPRGGGGGMSQRS